VNFLNTLDGIKTIGSCQGHNDGGDTGNFNEPYITFICSNIRNLGLLASLCCAYEDSEEWIPERRKEQPKLKAYWSISVLAGEDSECTPEELIKDGRNPEEYVMYCLSPDPVSYVKPTDVYSDLKEILRYYKIKNTMVNGKDFNKTIDDQHKT
jgi:hypothetical protein